MWIKAFQQVSCQHVRYCQTSPFKWHQQWPDTTRITWNMWLWSYFQYLSDKPIFYRELEDVCAFFFTDDAESAENSDASKTRQWHSPMATKFSDLFFSLTSWRKSSTVVLMSWRQPLSIFTLFCVLWTHMIQDKLLTWDCQRCMMKLWHDVEKVWCYSLIVSNWAQSKTC